MRYHFLQSSAWAAFQKALRRNYSKGSSKEWHALAIVEKGKLATRLYCPYGPSVAKKEDLQSALQWLKTEAQQKKVDFVRIEPLIGDSKDIDAHYLKSLGLKPSKKDVQPKYSIRVDLQKSAEEVMAAMSQTTRNLYRNIHKKDVTFKESSDPNDMKELIAMLKQVAKRTGMTPHSDHYLQTEAETLLKIGKAKIFIAEVKARPVAMALIYCDENGWYYSHAASYPAARKLQVMQPLVAHCIMEAHRFKAAFFDLYGIAPPAAPSTHPLAPITKFKESFGGQKVAFSGTWELPIKQFRYLLYKMIRTITKN